MKEMYYIIHNGEGDTTVEEVTKEELLKRIEEHYYGPVGCLDSCPVDSDTNYWGENILIIKGRVVTPKPEQVVTKLTIE